MPSAMAARVYFVYRSRYCCYSTKSSLTFQSKHSFQIIVIFNINATNCTWFDMACISFTQEPIDEVVTNYRKTSWNGHSQKDRKLVLKYVSINAIQK